MPSRRSGRRLLVRASLLLLAGAMVNVVVAWAITFGWTIGGQTDDTYAPTVFDDDHGVVQWWGVERYTAFGSEFYLSSWSNRKVNRAFFENKVRPESILPRWSSLGPPDMAFLNGGADRKDQIETARGWPMRSLSFLMEIDMDTRAVIRSHWALPAGQVNANPPFPRLLPMRPIPMGFVVNTFVDGVALSLLVVTPGVVRRRFRRRAGRCEACGYDLRGAPHTACPECGGE